MRTHTIKSEYPVVYVYDRFTNYVDISDVTGQKNVASSCTAICIATQSYVDGSTSVQFGFDADQQDQSCPKERFEDQPE